MKREDAASESIGTILILAITLTGIGIIAALLLGNWCTDDIPQFEISIIHELNPDDESLRQLTIHHLGGDPVKPEQVRVSVNGDEPEYVFLNKNITWLASTTSFTVGDTLTVYSGEIPRDIIIVYLGACGETLLYKIPSSSASSSSASIATRINYPPSGEEPRPPDWRSDTTPPHISGIQFSPSGTSFNVGDTVQIRWTASDNVQLKGAMIELCDTGGCQFLTPLTSATTPYSWTIPYSLGSDWFIRVTVYDIAGNQASDQSSTISIVDEKAPVVTVTSPKSGDSYKMGSVVPITWTATDNTGVTSVTITATIPGQGDISIATGIQNTGSSSWTIPDNINYRTNAATISVQAVDTNGNTGSGVSQPFIIGESTAPTVTISSPAGSPSFEFGDELTIGWTASDNIDVTTIDLAYSVSGGAWKAIGSGLSNTGSYIWTVPDDPSANVRIRVTAHDADGNSASAISDPFTITTPPGAEIITLFLFYPDGGENLVPGNTFTIQWSAGTTTPHSISGIDIAYSVDNGATWSTISTGENNDSAYSWKVPTTPTTQGRVRIIAHSDSGKTASAMSHNTFTIKNPDLTVILSSPNGGEVLNTGSVYPIIWTAEDPDGVTGISDIKLEYSLDNGGTWILIGSGVPNTGSYDWTIPYDETTQARVKVTATGTYGDTKSDTSNAPFTITNTPPVVTVIAPNGGETWTVGSHQYINWTASDPDGIGSVALWYSTNRGSSYTLIDTVSNTGSYSWTVPAPATTTAVIRVIATDTRGKSTTDYSDRVFTVTSAPPLVTVTVPNGGEKYTVGDEIPISWTLTDPGTITSIDIAYTTSDSTSPIPIATGLANTETSYSWTVPDSPTTSARVIVTVHTTGGDTQSDRSNGYFTISPIAGETITLFLFYPDGGETLTPGSSFTISWSASATSGITGIDLAYSINNGGTWTTIVTGTSNTGTYSWTVPSQATTQGRVRVTAYSSAGATATKTSTGAFTISDPPSSVTLLSPNGGENWNIGTEYPITWTASDPEGISSIALAYSSDNGATWVSIATGIANTGSYPWTTPTIETTTARIRVTATDIHGNTASDTSNAPFTIGNTAPLVTVISPNGGESWIAGSQQQVTWTATDPDDIASIAISYWTGTQWESIATVSNTGSYLWTLPSVSTSITTARIRIIATDNAGKSSTDYSDAVFSIVVPTPSVTVISPNGGESYATGSTQTISWTSVNSQYITSIDVAYNINDSSIHTPIATGLAGTSSSYSWTVPNTPSTRIKVIVKAYTSAGKTVSDASNSFFTIIDSISPTITINEPHGGESWQGNPSSNPKRIEWTASDNVGVVRIKLEYSINGGSTWKNIIDYLSNNGYYYWYVPKDYSSTCKVKGIAYDEAGNSGSGISAGLFSIVT